ncbi:MAG: non-homologous end-joining DNA ligase [Jatrophihabitans sp.]
MLATAGSQPVGQHWSHEVKWDGMRVLAEITDSRLLLRSRTGRDITAGYPELQPIARVLKDAVLDGEIIALRDGLPSFAALADRMHVEDARRAAELAEQQPVSVMTFDLLRLYGVELIGRPWTERRASLEQLELAGTGWSCSPVYDDGPALLAATAEQGLEGVVAKRRRAAYQPGRRSGDWIKTAHRQHQACVVGGWRRLQGTSSDQLGGLLLGVSDDAGGFSYAGRVGSGISRDAGRRLRQLLDPLRRADSPFATEVPAIDADATIWCRPQVVIEVRHLHWTGSGRLRHPVYRGLRTDLDPGQVRRES